MRIVIVLAVGLACAACEFVRVQPVPTPIPLPLPSTVRGSAGTGGASGGGLPPTPQQRQAALGLMGTDELCGLLGDADYGNDALSEIKQRGDFSDFEITRIVRRELAEGLSEGAIRCAFGRPQDIVTRGRDSYDLVYRYRGEGFRLPPAMWGGETRIYFLEGRVVDFRRVPPAGAGTGSQIRLAGN